MATKTRSAAEQSISIQALDRGKATVTLMGKTPLIVNKMSAKAKNTLLLGGRRKTAAERLEIKHHPIDEFRESMYLDDSFHSDTMVKFPVTAFKSAMATAALATPGMKKADVLRMVYISDEFCPIFGIPKLRMDIVRSSDMARTPDVRTRAIFSEWGTRFDIHFIRPQLSLHAVALLLNNAGLVCGVAENRQEKGKGSFGTFETVDSIPVHLEDLKDAQRAAIAEPEPANEDSAALLAEYFAAMVKAE